MTGNWWSVVVLFASIGFAARMLWQTFKRVVE